MATCYRCGKNISPDNMKQRRNVKTSEWIRKTYPSNRLGSIRVTYGRRIVCHRCARAIDIEQGRDGRIWLLQLVFWLLVLFAFLVFDL